jgi:hypothetical protein
LLFRHVVFVPVPAHPWSLDGHIHVRTGAPPHLYLGRFRISGGIPVSRGAVSAALPELRFTRVADVYELPLHWQATGCYLDMPGLRTVRRLFDRDELVASHDKALSTLWLPCHRTFVNLVDFVDLNDPIVHTTKRSPNEIGLVVPPGDTKHHIIHLAWDEGRVPLRTARPYWPYATARTLVLCPYGERRGDCWETGPCAACIPTCDGRPSAPSRRTCKLGERRAAEVSSPTQLHARSTCRVAYKASRRRQADVHLSRRIVSQQIKSHLVYPDTHLPSATW